MEEKETNVVEEGKEETSKPAEDTVDSSTSPKEEGKTEGTSTEVADPDKPGETQSKEENAKFAKMRHERDVAKAKAAGDAEGYKRARIKSVGGKNPYSDNAPIETDEDYEFYELQDEVNSRGLDPKNPLEIEKVRRELAAKKAEELEKNKTQEQKDRDRADQEVKDYLDEGHTQEELQGYWKDPKFQAFAEGLLGMVPLKTIIAKFDSAYPKGTEGKKEAAKKISNPGSASNDEHEVPKKKISEMTDEEFARFYDGVSKGKIKIS